jgi:formylmethanofuran dehydrogenase subunit E-like metal-binding protein
MKLNTPRNAKNQSEMPADRRLCSALLLTDHPQRGISSGMAIAEILPPALPVAAAAATKKPDGTFTAARIDFGRGDVLP